jgi:hypothetical protein
MLHRQGKDLTHTCWQSQPGARGEQKKSVYSNPTALDHTVHTPVHNRRLGGWR